jgi:hypothetical protein
VQPVEGIAVQVTPDLNVDILLARFHACPELLVAFAEILRRGPVDYGFDAAADPAHRFRLCRPKLAGGKTFEGRQLLREDAQDIGDSDRIKPRGFRSVEHDGFDRRA